MPAIYLGEAIRDLQVQIEEDDNIVAWPLAFNKRVFYGSEFYQEVGYKPFGLWFGCGPDWLDKLVAMESTSTKPRSGKHFVYKLELDKSDYIIINRDSQLKAFSKKFSLGPYDVNWPAVAEEATGIEICPFLYRAAGGLDWYYPWDVASGCTWDADTVIGVEELSR